MKNTMRCFGLIALAAVIGFSFAACGDGSGNGGGGGGSTHTHTYSTTWSNNATQHWHECTANDGAKTDVANHTFSGNICSVCNYNNGGDNWTWTAVANSPFRLYTDSRGDNRVSTIYGIAYGIADGASVGRFVAVGGDARMAYSDDGITWTGVTVNTIWEDTSADEIYCIAYGGGRWVAAGMRGKMAYSSDGVTWTAVADSTFGTTGIRGIAYGSAGNASGRFVAVGEFGKIAYSSDGITWTAVADSKITGQINAIAYGGGRWVAVGDDGQMASSSDGITWTAVSTGTIWEYTYSDGSSAPAADITAIVYGNNRFVAGGQNRKMAYSSDGVNWTAVAGNPSGSTWRGIAYGSASNAGNRFVAVGDYSRMAYSADGVTWVYEDMSLFYLFDNGRDIDGIAYGNGRFVAVGSSGMMVYADW